MAHPTPWFDTLTSHMARISKGRDRRLATTDGYGRVLGEVVGLLEQARRTSSRAVNAVMTSTYWQVGRRIVDREQRGEGTRGLWRAIACPSLARFELATLAAAFQSTTSRVYGRFYLAYPSREISETSSRKSALRNSETLSRKFTSANPDLLIEAFPLPWSHYVRLLTVESPPARQFYEVEALRGGWTVKQLDRQISTMFYERTAMSRNKAAMLGKHNRRKSVDSTSPDEEMKDPFVLEFLGLKDEYSETELEDALIRHMESFLLELGGEFTFVGRQRRLRVGGAWYRIDLLFYHRRLRCPVIIDVKTGRFTHADAGQMHLYCNYARNTGCSQMRTRPSGWCSAQTRQWLIIRSKGSQTRSWPQSIRPRFQMNASSRRNRQDAEVARIVVATKRRKS